MDATAKAITALLLENWPNPYCCYPCLAAKLRVTEREARLRCGRCRQVDDLLQKLLSA